MRCNRLGDLLPAYLDGDLSSRLNDQVSAHLDACERCRLALDEQQQSLRFLDKGRYAPSIDLWADFSRRLQEQSRPQPSPWRFLWQPGLAGAAAAVVVGLVVLSAPEQRAAARRLPAPAGSVQIARSMEAPPTPAAPSGLLFAPPAAQPASPAPRPALDRESGGSARITTATAQTAPPAMRPRRMSRRKAEVILAKSSTGAASRRLSRDHRPDRDEDRRSWRTASLPPAPTPVGGAGFAGADAGTAGPLDAAEALMSVQQDAASDQMQDELLLMAREVARVSGELPTHSIAGDAAGTGT
jgi:hypothetical protein